ncbi:MAG: helix-turn-helix transcriptional regulator [Aeromicrobium sp.]
MTTSTVRTREDVERAAASAVSATELFGEVAAAIRRTMPLDGWCGHTLDPATSMVTGGDAREGYLPELVPRLLEIEYVEGDVNPFHGLLQQEEPVGTIHVATGEDPQASARYRDVVVPSGFEHEMRAVFRHQNRPWGALVMLRAFDAPAFTPSEAALMASVSTVLAEAVKRLMLRGYVDGGGIPRQSGLVILDAAGNLETATPEAERWLASLQDTDRPVPLTVAAVASQVAKSDGTSVRSRARDQSGTWVTITAWPLDDRVAVSLEPSAPHDLTAIALEAYSLSDRERQVVERVLLGYSTAEIGVQLFLSPYTVQDHLKSVFDKTGVRSRRELAADLFFKHYLPRIERGSRLNADGWFADEPETA